jgi:predicted transcriptional regulator
MYASSECNYRKIHLCLICGYESYRKNNVHRHIIRKHADSTSNIDEETEKKEYNPTFNVDALKNMIVGRSNEYLKKVKLGREIKLIMREIKAPRACLDKEQMEALTLFEKHDRVKKIDHPS